MNNDEIDGLCREWLSVHYSQEIADEYVWLSLVTPDFNSPYLNVALDDFLGCLGDSFGTEETFLNTDYDEARTALGLPDERTAIPVAFVRAFKAS